MGRGDGCPGSDARQTRCLIACPRGGRSDEKITRYTSTGNVIYRKYFRVLSRKLSFIQSAEIPDIKKAGVEKQARAYLDIMYMCA